MLSVCHAFGDPLRIAGTDKSHPESMQTNGIVDAVLRRLHAFGVRSARSKRLGVGSPKASDTC